jgi:hypothetical protein
MSGPARIVGGIAALAAAIVVVPAAAPAAPIDDYNVVRADWITDTVITPCKFTLTQLVNARNIAATADTYNDLPEKLDKEIASQRAGHCVNTPQPGSTLKATISPTRAKLRVRRTFTITVRTRTVKGKQVPVKNVIVRFAKHRPKTNSKGQVKITTTFTRVQTQYGSVALKGFKTSRFTVKVVK